VHVLGLLGVRDDELTPATRGGPARIVRGHLRT
jgi:hypothetical protein